MIPCFRIWWHWRPQSHRCISANSSKWWVDLCR